MKKKSIKEAQTFHKLLDLKYGKIGSTKRDIFEKKAKYFVIKTMQSSK